MTGRRLGLWVDQGDGTSLRADQRPGRPSAILDGYTADVLATPRFGGQRAAADSTTPGTTAERELRVLRDLPKNDREADPYAWARMVRDAQAGSLTVRPDASAEAVTEADGPEMELEAGL
jgi:hypothetical protein